MTISKKLLKREIEATKILIEGLKEESKNYPQIASHNAKSILRLEGKIQAYNQLLNF